MKMKCKLYNQIVLTVIATCLIILVLKDVDVIPTAYAGKKEDVQLSKFGYVPMNADGSINVKLVNMETLNVNIDEVGGSSAACFSGELVVRVKK